VNGISYEGLWLKTWIESPMRELGLGATLVVSQMYLPGLPSQVEFPVNSN
jgi:hypothetical protein